MIAFPGRKRTLLCTAARRVAALPSSMIMRAPAIRPVVFGSVTLAIVAALFGAAEPGVLAVRPGANGGLVYQPDERGNTIPDFSRAGYGGGGVKIPDVPVAVTLAPQAAGDDGARIQAAIDATGKRTAD